MSDSKIIGSAEILAAVERRIEELRQQYAERSSTNEPDICWAAIRAGSAARGLEAAGMLFDAGPRNADDMVARLAAIEALGKRAVVWASDDQQVRDAFWVLVDRLVLNAPKEVA